MADKLFWYQLDNHLPEVEFENKVKTKRGYVLLENDSPVGLLRYNLFWDNIPFCTMLFTDEKVQSKGYGSMLMNYWEEDMKKQEYGMLLTSTCVDETAQHFYRKLEYKDCIGRFQEKGLDGFLVQMRRGAFLPAVKLVVALPDDPAVFAVGVPHLEPYQFPQSPHFIRPEKMPV